MARYYRQRQSKNSAPAMALGVGAVVVLAVGILLTTRGRGEPAQAPATQPAMAPPVPARTVDPSLPKPVELTEADKAAIVAAVQVALDSTQSLVRLQAEYEVALKRISESTGLWPGLYRELLEGENLMDEGWRLEHEYDRRKLRRAAMDYLFAVRSIQKSEAAAALKRARSVAQEER